MVLEDVSNMHFIDRYLYNSLDIYAKLSTVKKTNQNMALDNPKT